MQHENCQQRPCSHLITPFLFFISGYKLNAIVEKYNLDMENEPIYIGLSDHHEEGEWIWASNGRILNETAVESNYLNGDRKVGWAYGEPNGKKREDCVGVTESSFGVSLRLFDIECTTELDIICEINFSHQLDVSDLPK